MPDRDSFMIHSVNIYLAHHASALLDTLCMLEDVMPSISEVINSPK